MLVKVTCPVLALFGEKDVQVPADKNAEAAIDALNAGGVAGYRVEELSDFNHFHFKKTHF